MHSVFISTLGQLDWQAAPPPALGRPPLLTYALFENPLPLGALLVAAAVIGGYMLNRAGRLRPAVAVTAGCLAAAVGVVVLGSTITTRREAAMNCTVALVAAVAQIDEPGMRRLLAEDARLVVSERVPEVSVPITGLERDPTIDLVRTVLTRHRIREHQTRSVSAELTGVNTARTQCRVRVVVEGEGVAHNSWWRIIWRLEPDGSWRAIEVRPYSLDFVGVVGR